MTIEKQQPQSLTEPQRLWVEALRSGDYKWGKDELHPSSDGFCCLGVACELAVKAGVIDYYRPDNTTLQDYPEVEKWLGLNSHYGRFGDTDLTSINDNAKRNPFKRIAKIIESKPDGLFVE